MQYRGPELPHLKHPKYRGNLRAWAEDLEQYLIALDEEFQRETIRNRASKTIYVIGTGTVTVITVAGTSTTTETSTDPVLIRLCKDLKTKRLLR